MRNHDLMKDPFYAQLSYVVESAICKADQEAQKKGIRLTDSNIKSALNKARRITPQRSVLPLDAINTREAFIEELALSIAAQREILEHTAEDGSDGTAISHADWVKAILVVEASLKLRKSDEPGSRFYLDFVRRFIELGEL